MEIVNFLIGVKKKDDPFRKEPSVLRGDVYSVISIKRKAFLNI